MAAAAAQLYGSAVLSKRCFVRHNSSSLCYRNQNVRGSNISDVPFTKKNSLRTVAFDANSAVQYTEDQNGSQFNGDFNNGHIHSTSILEQMNEKTGSSEEIEDSPPKNYAKIHDFCFAIPFGLFVFTTGIISFLLWKSSESLLFGVAPGLAIFGLGVISLNVWKNCISSLPFILAQTAIAAGLIWKYVQKISLTKKFLPWGIYGFVSAFMLCFYMYVLFSGGNPPPKKKAGPVPN